MRRIGKLFVSLAVACVVLGIGAAVWAYLTEVAFGSGSATLATFDPPTGADASANGGLVTVEWTGSTAPNGGAVDGFIVHRHNGSTSTEVCGSTTASPLPGASTQCVDAAPDGTYTYTVVAIFRSWTAQSDPTGAVLVINDNVPPTGQVTAPAAGAKVRDTITVSSNSADTGSGVASANFQRSPAGANTWTDLGAPDLTPSYSVPFDTTGVADGLYDLRVVTTDNAGNSFTSSVVGAVRVDNTAPTGAITAPVGGAAIRQTITVSSNAADAGSGVASAQFSRSPAGASTWTNLGAADTISPYSVTFDTTTVSGGNYDIRVTVIDQVGHSFTSPTVTVTVDNTNPTGSVTAPLSSALVHDTITMTSNSADSGSGVASARFQRAIHNSSTWTDIATDTEAPYSVDWNTATVANAFYDVRVVTTDRAGNTFTSGLVTNVRTDNTDPSGSITAPANGADVRATITVTASSSDSGSGVASVQFQYSPLGANTWTNLGSADTNSPYSTSFVTTTVANGDYDLRVVATDVAGNAFTSVLVTITVDNTNPTGSITAPLDESWVRGTITVTSDSADALSGVQSALFQRANNGSSSYTNIGGADTSAPYSASLNTGSLSNGNHDLRVITTDRAGNTFTSPIVDIQVDNSAPSNGSFSLPDFVRNDQVLSSTWSESGSGIQTVEYLSCPGTSCTPSTLVASSAGPSPYSFTWSSMPADGSYRIGARAIDVAGNVSAIEIETVDVQNSAPAVQSVAVQRGGTTNQIDDNDDIVVTFTQALQVSSLCSSWSGDDDNQSLSSNNQVTVTLTDGGASANDTLAVSATGCTFNFGTIDLGSKNWITGGNRTFVGSGSSRNEIHYDAGLHRLTIEIENDGSGGTIGTVSGTVNAFYTPSSAIKNAVGTAISPGPFGFSGSLF